MANWIVLCVLQGAAVWVTTYVFTVFMFGHITGNPGHSLASQYWSKQDAIGFMISVLGIDTDDKMPN